MVLWGWNSQVIHLLVSGVLIERGVIKRSDERHQIRIPITTLHFIVVKSERNKLKGHTITKAGKANLAKQKTNGRLILYYVSRAYGNSILIKGDVSDAWPLRSLTDTGRWKKMHDWEIDIIDSNLPPHYYNASSLRLRDTRTQSAWFDYRTRSEVEI